jgi:hypothetical protein
MHKRSAKIRGDGTIDRKSIRIEDDQYALFEEYVPTDERLKGLRQRWIDIGYLQRRLLYCRPFYIVFEEPETSFIGLWPRNPKRKALTKLVRRSHHQLGELLQEGKLEDFLKQLSKAWPDTFGSRINPEGQPQRFQWHLGVPQLDDGTVILCRKSNADATQHLLMVEVSIHPSDNVIW